MTKKEAKKIVEKLIKGRILQRKSELKYLKQYPYEPKYHLEINTKIILALQTLLDYVKNSDKKRNE